MATDVRRPVLAQIGGLLAWLVVCFVAAAVGAIASLDAVDFYTSLERPAWAPPAGAFAPVWNVLFVLMAVAAWLVWLKRGTAGARGAFALFLAQLICNAAWSWAFFVWRSGAWAVVNALLLWLLVLATLVAFWRLRKVAAILLLPYLLWVTYALGLTYSIWRLNPRSL